MNRKTIEAHQLPSKNLRFFNTTNMREREIRRSAVKLTLKKDELMIQVTKIN